MMHRRFVGVYRNHIFSALLLAAILLWSLPAIAQKTDTLYLTNGDRVTCEVKTLERGRLTIKTANMGTLTVEWEAVDRIVTDKTQEILLTNGRRVFGELADSGESRVLAVRRENVSERVDVDDVAALEQVLVDRSFWQRLDGKAGLGLNYTKGSDVGQLFFTGNTKFRKFRSEYQLNWSTILTSTKGDDSQRGNLGGAYRRYLENRWFWTALANYDRNDELGIDGRISGGGGGGRTLLQSKGARAAVVAGAVATRENTAAQGENDTNIEAILVGDLAFFKFTIPKTDFRTTLTIWPSITDWGRVRGNLDATLGQHIFTDDFSLDLTAYMTYDSSPPSGGEKEDFGIITSINYTF
jgi:hypothetical protein